MGERYVLRGNVHNARVSGERHSKKRTVCWLTTILRAAVPACYCAGDLEETMNAPLRCNRNKQRVTESVPGLAPEREPLDPTLASLGRQRLATARAVCERPAPLRPQLEQPES